MRIDTHIHLDLMDDMNSFVESISQSNIGAIAVGTTPTAYLHDKSVCSKASNIYVALGLHPQLINSGYDDLQLFETLVEECRFIGEIGLDFSVEYVKTKEMQINAFRKIIFLCEKYGNKVVSVHSLKAVSEVLNIINEYKKDNSNIYILHWFTGTKSQCREALDMGCYFSINPKMVSTKSGQEIIKMIPPNRILLETDAPFATKIYDGSELERKLGVLVEEITIIKN